jgi:serine/threonine-protein kinase
VIERLPGDVAARDGLDRVLCAGARWHLVRGEWQAADALLRECAVVPDGARAAVVAARRAAEERDARLRQLEDTTAGVRTRAFVMTIMGLLWVLTPLAYGAYTGGRIGGYGEGAAFALVFGAIGLVLGFWGRESLSKSALNRRVRWVMAGPAGIMLVNTAGTWLLGLDPTDAFVMLLLPFAALCTNLAVTFDRRFIVPGIAYTVSFLASAWAPSCALAWLSLGNAVLTVTVLLIGARDLGEALAEDFDAAVQRRHGRRDQKR